MSRSGQFVQSVHSTSNRSSQRTGNHLRGGFTLVELLVVISIIALLVSILMPALNKARGQAQAAACAAQIRHYGIAVVQFAGDNDDWFPRYAIMGKRGTDYSNLYPEGTWYNLLAPYVGGEKVSGTPQEKADSSVRNAVNKFRMCPSNKAWMVVNYGGMPPNVVHAPFIWGPLNKGGSFKSSSIKNPSEWIEFLDGRRDPSDTTNLSSNDGIVNSPSGGWAFDKDFDGDGIDDTNAASEPYVGPYNGTAAKVHNNGFNMVLCDGHVERMTFDEFQNPNNRYWTGGHRF